MNALNRSPRTSSADLLRHLTRDAWAEVNRDLVAKAREVYAMLKKHMNCFYDETAAIGRRYARQDEAGTPFGVTIDFDTLGEKGEELKDTVTVRERDSNAQHRMKISEVLGWIMERIA